ncbi:MAG: META domain-containing protein [Candidatus Limnocylindrales bacterium]
MSRTGPLPVVLGALLLVGAMGGTTLANDGPGADPLIDPNPNASAGAPTLEGTEWLLVKAQLSGAYADIPAEVVATLLMKDGQAGGSGGCNEWFAGYTLDGSSLVFGDIGSTLMMCDGAGGQVETFYFADLASVRTWAIDGTTLTLSGDIGPVLAFEPRAASGPVIDGDWLVVEYNDGQGSLVAVDDGLVAVSIAGGELTGTAGCNSFFGSITQDGSAITVGQVGGTEMYCDGLMEREAAVMASLMASTQVQTDGTGLVLLDGAGTVQLRLVPAGDAPSAEPSPAA